MTEFKKKAAQRNNPRDGGGTKATMFSSFSPARSHLITSAEAAAKDCFQKINTLLGRDPNAFITIKDVLRIFVLQYFYERAVQDKTTQFPSVAVALDALEGCLLRIAAHSLKYGRLGLCSDATINRNFKISCELFVSLKLHCDLASHRIAKDLGSGRSDDSGIARLLEEMNKTGHFDAELELLCRRLLIVAKVPEIVLNIFATRPMTNALQTFIKFFIDMHCSKSQPAPDKSFCNVTTGNLKDCGIICPVDMSQLVQQFCEDAMVDVERESKSSAIAEEEFGVGDASRNRTQAFDLRSASPTHDPQAGFLGRIEKRIEMLTGENLSIGLGSYDPQSLEDFMFPWVMADIVLISADLLSQDELENREDCAQVKPLLKAISMTFK
jgi:hypothetical protein